MSSARKAANPGPKGRFIGAVQSGWQSLQNTVGSKILRTQVNRRVADMVMVFTLPYTFQELYRIGDLARHLCLENGLGPCIPHRTGPEAKRGIWTFDQNDRELFDQLFDEGGPFHDLLTDHDIDPRGLQLGTAYAQKEQKDPFFHREAIAGCIQLVRNTDREVARATLSRPPVIMLRRPDNMAVDAQHETTMSSDVHIPVCEWPSIIDILAEELSNAPSADNARDSKAIVKYLDGRAVYRFSTGASNNEVVARIAFEFSKYDVNKRQSTSNFFYSIRCRTAELYPNSLTGRRLGLSLNKKYKGNWPDISFKQVPVYQEYLKNVKAMDKLPNPARARKRPIITLSWPRPTSFYLEPPRYTFLDDDKEDFHDGKGSREFPSLGRSPSPPPATDERHRLLYGDEYRHQQRDDVPLVELYWNGNLTTGPWRDEDTAKVNEVFGWVGIPPHVVADWIHQFVANDTTAFRMMEFRYVTLVGRFVRPDFRTHSPYYKIGILADLWPTSEDYMRQDPTLLPLKSYYVADIREARVITDADYDSAADFLKSWRQNFIPDEMTDLQLYDYLKDCLDSYSFIRLPNNGPSSLPVDLLIYGLLAFLRRLRPLIFGLGGTEQDRDLKTIKRNMRARLIKGNLFRLDNTVPVYEAKGILNSAEERMATYAYLEKLYPDLTPRLFFELLASKLPFDAHLKMIKELRPDVSSVYAKIQFDKEKAQVMLDNTDLWSRQRGEVLPKLLKRYPYLGKVRTLPERQNLSPVQLGKVYAVQYGFESGFLGMDLVHKRLQADGFPATPDFSQWPAQDLLDTANIIRESLPEWWNAMQLPYDTSRALASNGIEVGDRAVTNIGFKANLRLSPAVPSSSSRLKSFETYTEFAWRHLHRFTDNDFETFHAIMLRLHQIPSAKRTRPSLKPQWAISLT